MRNPFHIITENIDSAKFVVTAVGKEKIKEFVIEEVSEKGKKALNYLHDSLKDYTNENLKKASDEIKERDFSDEKLEDISLNHENNFVREAAKRELEERKDN